jgi:hypothetical protein
MTFKQKASACFAIAGTDNNVTVKGVPYEWNPAQGARDSQAAVAVARYIGENNLTEGRGLALIWVESAGVAA